MAVNVLTPIETRYAGHLFRSRLEARWALFYDKIRIPWLYEHEGYDLNGVWYLPDFWMPRQDCFIEVKGAYPTLEEQCRAALLSQISGKQVFIFGPLPTIARYGLIGPVEGEWGPQAFFPVDAGDIGYHWCRELSTGEYHILPAAKIIPRHNSATDELVYAYNAARSTRF